MSKRGEKIVPFALIASGTIRYLCIQFPPGGKEEKNMQEYTSKQVRILRPAGMVYGLMSDFTNFTPILGDKVEGWQATPDTCSFKAKGMNMGLRIIEREENRLVKITGDDGSPFEFTLWMQMQEVAPADTRMRLVLHVKLNMMMKMMIGKKLEEGINQIADQIATTFNNAPV